MRNAIIVLLALFILSSCKTVQKNEVEKVFVHDTIRSVSVLRDSIYTCDSVFVNQYVKGDTVFRDKEKFVTMFREKLRIDTLYQVRDSIVYRDREVIKEKKQKSWAHWVWMGIVGGGLFGLGAWLLRRKFN